MADDALPQYEWGVLPKVNPDDPNEPPRWGYILRKAGSDSAKLGNKAGDMRTSYSGPKGDTAALQAQVLQHLQEAQTDSGNNPGAATDANAAVKDTPIAKMSGIAAAASGHGSTNKWEDPNAEWTNMSDADKAAWYSEHPNYSAITQLGQKLWGYTSLGALQDKMMPGFADRQSLIAQGINPDNPGGQGTSGSNGNGMAYGPMGGGGYAVPVGGDPTDPYGSGEQQAQQNTDYIQHASDDSVAAAAADSPRAAADSPRAAAAAEGAAYDPHEHSSSTYNSGGGSDYSSYSNSNNESRGDSPSYGSSYGGYAKGGPVQAGLQAGVQSQLPARFVRGPGDGQSDSIPVQMDDGAPGALADNEFVVPADAVSALGSGSSEAGARALYEMVDRIRQTAHGHTKQANPVDPNKVLPA